MPLSTSTKEIIKELINLMRRKLLAFLVSLFIVQYCFSQEEHFRVKDSLDKFSIELGKGWKDCKRKITRGYFSILSCVYFSEDRSRYIYLGIYADTVSLGNFTREEVIDSILVRKRKLNVYNRRYDSLYGHHFYAVKVKEDWFHEKYPHIKMKVISDKLYIEKKDKKGVVMLGLSSYMPDKEKDSIMLHQLLKKLVIK